MENINANKAGLAFGSFLAVVHLVWAILVLLGCAQWIMDTIMALHMIEASTKILPFDILASLGLIVMTFTMGYIFGFVFAKIWNCCCKCCSCKSSEKS